MPPAIEKGVLSDMIRATAFAIFAVSSVLVVSPTDSAETAARHRGIARLTGRPTVVLVSEQLPPAPILIRSDAPPREKQAADALASYLSQISGTEFKVISAELEISERAILVGEVDSQPPDGVSDEGFVILTEDGRLRICGGTPHATTFAVFSLLEEQLGCRWWSWNEENVPTSETIEVAAQNTHIEPAFRRHNVYNREAQNRRNDFAYKLRTISLTSFTGGHNLCPLLKPHAEKNAEFLPMDKEGVRKFNNLHMNYTADGIDAALAEALKQQVVKRRGDVKDVIYFAGMGDWYGGMDLSPESKRIYDEETWTDPDGRKKPGYSATLLRMINRTAETLEGEYPGIQVGTFAYMSLEAPPDKTRPRDNVAIRIPRLRHDTVRSILESEKNQSFRRNLDRWLELAPHRVYIWEYGANFGNFLRPFPCLRSIAENIKYYRQAGVAGISIQGNYVATGGDLAVLKNYVWAKLLWDPTREIDELVAEFCTGYYGPAAEEMLAYVNLMEQSVRGQPPISADEFDTRLAWMTPELVKRAQTLFKKALARTKGDDSDPYFRRVKEAEVGLEAWQLWKEGPLVEDGEKLIRADLGMDTFPRAQSLVKYCRDASPREWGNGVKYRMSFLVLHGGPMPTLKQGPVTVKVAPVQNGQIRSVLYNDQVAIDQSRVKLALGSVTYELTTREGNRVEMKADLGLSMWSPAGGKQTGYQIIELDPDGEISCSGEVERRGSGSPTNQAVFESVYQVGKQPEKLSVEYQDDPGVWKRLRVDAQNAKASIPTAAHFRITRHDRGLQIDDRYTAPESTPTATVQYDPEDATVLLSVDMGTVQVPRKGRVTFGRREIRLKSSVNSDG